MLYSPWTQLTVGRCPPLQTCSPALILVVSGPRLGQHVVKLLLGHSLQLGGAHLYKLAHLPLYLWFLARVLDSMLYSCSLDTADSWAVPTFTNLLTCPYTCDIWPASWTACCTAAPWTQLTAGRTRNHPSQPASVRWNYPQLMTDSRLHQLIVLPPMVFLDLRLLQQQLKEGGGFLALFTLSLCKLLKVALFYLLLHFIYA